jgi:glycosyltransferase involved in cell wall biosynthesis
MSSDRGISITMPCYNARRYLEQAVASVYAQNTSLPFEIIIVDDGSIDGTRELILPVLQKKYPEVRVILPPRAGQPKARNIALEAAKYPYILPLDADDMLNTAGKVQKHGCYMDRAVEILEKNQDIAFVYARGNYFGATFGPMNPLPYNEKNMLSFTVASIFGIYRREEALKCGGYDEMLQHTTDRMFWLRLLENRFQNNIGRGVVKLPEPYYLYRVHTDGSNVGSKFKNRDLVSQRTLINAPGLCHFHYPGLTEENLLLHLKKNELHGLQAKFLFSFHDPRWFFSRAAAKTHKTIGRIFTKQPIPRFFPPAQPEMTID